MHPVSAALILAAAATVTTLQAQGLTGIALNITGSVGFERETFQIEAKDSKGRRRQLAVHFESAGAQVTCIVTMGSGKEHAVGTASGANAYGVLAAKAAKLLK